MMGMKYNKLGFQMNLFFGIFFFVPMTVAAVLAIMYFSDKIYKAEMNKTASDLWVAELLYDYNVKYYGNLARTYASNRLVVMLFGLDLGEKVGLELSKQAKLDNIDMITVVDINMNVKIRSHSPKTINIPFQLKKSYVDDALAGNSVSGTELITRKELLDEGLDLSNLKKPDDEFHIVITASAPIYELRNYNTPGAKKNILGVVIVRKILTENSLIADRIQELQNIGSAIFKKDILVAKRSLHQVGGGFQLPPKDVTDKVLSTRESIDYPLIKKNGSLSKLSQIFDFEGKPIGILMIQRGIAPYLEAKNFAILTVCFIFLFAAVIMYGLKLVINRRIVLPVESLTDGAERLGQGHYDSRLTVDSKDEMGILTRTFNTMAESLEKAHVELEMEVLKHQESKQVIEGSLNEKVLLLREVHHRVKNNLQIIYSLLSLATAQTRNQEAVNVLTDSSSRIYTMALIHMQLYESKHLDKVEMDRNVNDLASNLIQSYGTAEKPVYIVVEPTDVCLTITQAIPCGLVLNELISNSFKHAFKGNGGRIDVSIRKDDDDNVTITVQDDGQGFGEGIDPEAFESLGLRLITGLVQEQLSGKVDFRAGGNGAQVTIEFQAM